MKRKIKVVRLLLVLVVFSFIAASCSPTPEQQDRIYQIIAADPIVTTTGDRVVTLNWTKLNTDLKAYIETQGLGSVTIYYDLYRNGTVIYSSSSSGSKTYTDTNVKNGTTYSYYVKGEGSFWGFTATENSQTATVKPMPPVPQITSIVNNAKSLDLNWNTVSGATAYNIKRSTVSGGPYTTIYSTEKYLSDMTETSATNGYGPVEKDKSNGESAAGDGKTLKLYSSLYGYKTYSKGLGVHAGSTIIYNLGGKYDTFVSDIGIDDEVYNSNGSVIFQVWVDGVKAYDSGTMYDDSNFKTISVNVTGKNELKLVVTDSGNGNAQDHADWAGAKVVTNQTSYKDTNVTDGTTYYYVMSIIKDCESANSNQMSQKYVAPIKIEMYNVNTSADTKTIKAKYRLTFNAAADLTTLDLSKLKVRYYYTDDFEGYPEDFKLEKPPEVTEISIVGKTDIINGAVNKGVPETITNTANKYLEFTFSNGTLVKDNILLFTGEITKEIYWGTYYQLNDYSFNAKDTTYGLLDKVLLKYDEITYKGTEPVTDPAANPVSGTQYLRILSNRVGTIDGNGYAIGDVVPFYLKFETLSGISGVSQLSVNFDVSSPGSTKINLEKVADATKEIVIYKKDAANVTTRLFRDTVDNPGDFTVNYVNKNIIIKFLPKANIVNGDNIEIYYYVKLMQNEKLVDEDYPKTYTIKTKFTGTFGGEPVGYSQDSVPLEGPNLEVSSVNMREYKSFEAEFEVIKSKKMQ